MVGLAEAEKAILLFTLLVEVDPDIHALFEDIELSPTQVGFLLAHVLGFPRSEVASALRESGPLRRFELIEFGQSRQLREQLRIPYYRESVLSNEISDPGLLGSLFFEVGAEPRLNPNDYSHLAKEFGFLKALLCKSLSEQSTGVNVLLHGSPGLGKTEFVRVLAKELGVPLWVVRTMGSGGHALSRSERLSQLAATLRCVPKDEPCLICFDEIEDAFQQESAGSDAATQKLKGFMNHIMESCTRPVLWVGNQIDDIDVAHLRRFSAIVPFQNVPREVRGRVLDRALAGAPMSAETREWVVDNDDVSPAILETVVGSVKAASAGSGPAFDESMFTSLLQNHLRATGSRRPTRPSKLATHYFAEYLNTSLPDAEGFFRLAQGAPGGRLLSSGPPGTGKTAFMRELARRLGRPAHTHRASDLLSAFVGGTEERLAAAFEKARRDEAVLCIDEADSFLRSRGNARYGWEVTQVNEMLCQLENFEGWLGFTTNSLEEIDHAALRRFDLRISFFPLTPARAMAMIRSEVGENGKRVSNQALEHWARAWTGLCPGDFAAAKRRILILGLELTDERLMEELLAELKARRESAAAVVGFRE